jgi:predicted TIM-barrel fold metal-dependent hydrolase
MYQGKLVLDVHGHMSTPPHFRAYAMNLISLRTPEGELEMTDDLLRPALERHIRVMDARNIDVQLISPRPVAMMHWEMPHLVQQWTRVTNNVIAQICRAYPNRFTGVAQLPQTADEDTRSCVSELERCVRDLGFVGAILNPDPGAGRPVPGVNEPYWFPLYAAAEALSATLVVHPSISRDPRLAILPHSYQFNNLVEETLATQLYEQSDVFGRFPALKIVICHCGGAPSRFVPGSAQPSGESGGGQVGLTTRPVEPVQPARDLADNLFFDTCAYDLEFLAVAIKQRGVASMVFGTEAPGSGTALINPETQRASDDVLALLERLSTLTDADRQAIVHDNVTRAFPRLAAALTSRG